MKASSVSLLLTPTDSPHPDNMKASSVSLLLTLTDSPHPDNMKASSVSLLLGVSVLLLSALTVSAVSLEVSPNRPQFFREESVCLKCVGDGHTADGWTVKRTAGGHNEDFGRFDGSCYIISKLSQSDTGVYWCGTSSGQKSNQINITVTNYRGVILELPALPVMTGSDVTLRCRKRGVSTFEAFFFKNGVHIGSGPEGQFTISKVQQSDEGLYWCFIERTVESPRSWLRVRGPPALTTLLPPPPVASSPPPPPPPPPPADSSPPSSLLLPVGAAVGSLVLVLVLVLVGVVWPCRNQSGRNPAPEDVTYADVTIRQAANRRGDKLSADPDTVYSGVRTYTAGPSEVTYGHIIIRSKRTAGTRTGQSADPDVVYSSLRAGN
ncbi:uncharacterized protein LOC127359017 isoform X3 [Dicentrarchus labrax]|uniref:uncharacterized protein LOC127359017 isoform X3 n=1 Tax=Dicentrarchus labrax TaxID=13489 RepID=UPI0021F65BF7|nr:uncharacterized protein LOC127359017 isoform X3 [Dicentrarchus labrax]